MMTLMAQHEGDVISVVCGDGTQLPFATETFSSVVAILVLHHLKTAESQDRMLSEVMRVLRPGGVFVGFEITDGWMNRMVHMGSTFTPFSPVAAFGRLTATGFAKISVNIRSGAFRFSARKMRGSESRRRSGDRRSREGRAC